MACRRHIIWGNRGVWREREGREWEWELEWEEGEGRRDGEKEEKEGKVLKIGCRTNARAEYESLLLQM